MWQDVENLGQFGLLPDQPSTQLANGAWTDSRNVRYRDGAAEKIKGYASVFGGLSATAISSFTINDGSNVFWVYGSNSVLYGTDGTTHANVSHLSISYAASDDLGWTGAAFHGFVCLTDGSAIPQSWTPALGNDFTSLTAWPTATLTTKVLRAHGDFLFALRNTTSGSYNPRELRWSDRAGQGSLPQSWDYTDPTNQAGITELGQTGDLLVDALSLRNSLMVYKEFHTWKADYSGGLDVFSFQQVFSQSGMLTENCAIDFNDTHLVLTDSDVIVHDGNSARSILSKRMRRNFMSRINPNRFRRCFVAADLRNKEILVCVPENGFNWPNLALVWNWDADTLFYRDLGGTKTYGTHGTIPSGTTQTFDADSGAFDAATDSFDVDSYNPSSLKLVWLDASAPKAYQDDTGETFDGTSMQVYGERSSIPFSIDLERVFRVLAVIPFITGTAGDTFDIYIGTRQAIDDPVNYSGPYTFTLGTDTKVDCRLSGRLIDIRVAYSGSQTFRLSKFRIETYPEGVR